MAVGNGRTVVITGGATGIGKACATSFVADGDCVVLVGRREGVLRQAACELGPLASWCRADVGNREDVEAAVASVVREHGTIDVLVNNAGILEHPVSTATPLAEAERIWDECGRVNVKGTLLMSLACAAHLARPGGRVVLISSGAAFTGGTMPGMLAYAASKAALHGMMTSLARELGPDGITVNAIAPGFIADTEMMAGIPEGAYDRLASATVMKRIGRSDDVAAAVRYLCSPEASFVSAQLLHVNGGRLPG